MQSNKRPQTNSQATVARKRDTHVQSLKNRLRSNVNALVSNYEMILARSKIDTSDMSKGLGPYAQSGQDNFELSVRAANMVHACENITRLVSEIKQFLILGDFCWLSQVSATNYEKLAQRRAELEQVALKLRDKIACEVYALEEETPSSLSY